MTRRKLVAALVAVSALTVALAPPAQGQAGGKLKIGLMLPYTGTYAALGNAITHGFKLYVDESGGKLGGREIEYFVVDDESDPAKATENVDKLVKRDHVDVLVGTVHSGVAMAMAKVAKDTNTMLVVPNAGANDVTRAMCAPNIWRMGNTCPRTSTKTPRPAPGSLARLFLLGRFCSGHASGRGLCTLGA